MKKYLPLLIGVGAIVAYFVFLRKNYLPKPGSPRLQPGRGFPPNIKDWRQNAFGASSPLTQAEQEELKRVLAQQTARTAEMVKQPL
jgi:hypothetical protein